MKNVLRLLISLCLSIGICILSSSWGAPQKSKKSATPSKVVDSTAVHWMSIEEAQVAMKKEPRKVLIDVFTDWCGWCKVMDKKTFSNTQVIKYLNTYFYAVKLNAEQKDSISFMGNKYGFIPENRVNLLAAQLLNGNMSYPSLVLMEENFRNPQVVPGYQKVPMMEIILNYFGGNHYKTTPFDTYQSSYTNKWTES